MVRILLDGVTPRGSATQVLAICRVLPKLEGGALDVSGLFNNIAAEGLGVATSG